MSQEEIREHAAQLQQEQMANQTAWTQQQEEELQNLVAQDLLIQWQARKHQTVGGLEGL